MTDYLNVMMLDDIDNPKYREQSKENVEGQTNNSEISPSHEGMHICIPSIDTLAMYNHGSI